MRKLCCFLFCLVIALSLAGCGDGKSGGRSAGSKPAGVNDVLAAEMAKEDGKGTENEAGNSGNQTSAAQSGGSAADEKVDIDLTALSSTMVYTEVNNMMTTPEQYIGKTVKMSGSFAVYHDEETDVYYFACLIADATACCSQGIEFELAGNYTFPNDYPAVESEICVSGVFDTYQEGEYRYCTLRNAKLLS